jgi:hypothetical protein
MCAQRGLTVVLITLLALPIVYAGTQELPDLARRKADAANSGEPAISR